jgi:Ca2+-binding EF-hand superfamily protein
VIDVDEQEGPAGMMIQRMQASDSSIRPGQPVPLSKIKEAFEKMRGGGGRGGDDRGGRDDEDEESSTAASELVPGFGGLEMPLPVPGFGASAELMAVRVTDADVRQSEETMSRYDRNKNGFIDQDELSRRWSGNPLDFDQNRDGRLSSAELAVRYARSRLDRETEKNSSDNRSRRRDSSSNESADLVVKDRYEGRVSYKRTEASLPDGLPGWFAEKDANKDGQIRMSEYETEWNDELIAAFYGFDRNFDGVITAEEALITVERGPRGSAAPVSTAPKPSANISTENVEKKYLDYAKKILSRNDSNGDGELTVAEWKQMIMDVSPADLDKNGRISVEEYGAYLQDKAKR